jgi:hypothetical protein
MANLELLLWLGLTEGEGGGAVGHGGGAHWSRRPNAREEASPYTSGGSGGGFAIHRAMVTARWTAWLPGTAMAWTRWWWRRSGRHWCGPCDSGGGLGGVGMDSVASRSARENLVSCRRQVKILQLWFKKKTVGTFIDGSQ